VRRHSAAVYAACQQVTRNNHDAEDATQAVFLTLAIEARTRNGIGNVGGWLHQVARRVALDVVRARSRRRRREQAGAGAENGGRFAEDHPAKRLGLHEIKALLRQEISKLPAKYRLP